MIALPSMRQLRYLIAVGHYLNFTKAAEHCFVSQSTLSAGLKELEDSLGIQLIERDRQNVSVTPIGLEMIARAKQLLASAEDMVEYAKAASQAMTGTIRLGAIPTIAPFVLPQILPVIRERYPHLKIGLREDLSANLVQKIHEHQLDFAIIALPYETEGLLVKELYGDEFWLTAKPDDQALAGKTVTVPAKMAERLLLLEEGHCLREHSLRACRRSETANVDGLEATSLLTLVQMADSGLGIALLPEMAIRNDILKNTDLIARPLAAPAPKRGIALIARQTTSRIEEFLAIAKVMLDVHQASQVKPLAKQ
ncbi:LysR family transcriptional regulator [Polynucleobacter sp. MWH-Spelu-300-X4]|uniref:hydrogen peroxide-inducible genes activator n=1 Tax=Polynucleobacter sp. MWH-Spelu-300-X4 TaxID=2689109 RepID=UPI001BFD2A6F|nr:hydrogen peroxide-inducible genes activator [Polynucleobacter sp. MWH-Spelu-300-X4]QWD79210.1 LysR family transcriptional regulator [Polynucleobacter sp. MWH-Spelu-300-X4]